MTFLLYNYFERNDEIQKKYNITLFDFIDHAKII